jgi:hypothetical protein
MANRVAVSWRQGPAEVRRKVIEWLEADASHPAADAGRP